MDQNCIHMPNPAPGFDGQFFEQGKISDHDFLVALFFCAICLQMWTL